MSPAAWLCPRGELSQWDLCPSGRVSHKEGVPGVAESWAPCCLGLSLSCRSCPRLAHASAPSCPGLSLSCRSGVVSEEGLALLGLVGARGLFSAAPLCRGGTEVTAWPHPAVPPRPHPGHAHPKPLAVAKDPLLQLNIFVPPFCTSHLTKTRLFPFLPTCNTTRAPGLKSCVEELWDSPLRWKGQGQCAEGHKSLESPRQELQHTQAASLPGQCRCSLRGSVEGGDAFWHQDGSSSPKHTYRTGSPPQS